MVGEKVRRWKAAGRQRCNSRPETHPMAIEVGCLPARDFSATSRAAPVPLPGGERKRLF